MKVKHLFQLLLFAVVLVGITSCIYTKQATETRYLGDKYYTEYQFTTYGCVEVYHDLKNHEKLNGDVRLKYPYINIQFQANFKNGLIEGSKVEYDSSRIVIMDFFEHGLRQGYQSEFDKDASTTYNCVNGFKHGEQRYILRDTMRIITNFNMGIKSGVERYFNSKGVQSSTVKYTHDAGFLISEIDASLRNKLVFDSIPLEQYLQRSTKFMGKMDIDIDEKMDVSTNDDLLYPGSELVVKNAFQLDYKNCFHRQSLPFCFYVEYNHGSFDTIETTYWLVYFNGCIGCSIEIEQIK